MRRRSSCLCRASKLAPAPPGVDADGAAWRFGSQPVTRRLASVPNPTGEYPLSSHSDLRVVEFLGLHTPSLSGAEIVKRQRAAISRRP